MALQTGQRMTPSVGVSLELWCLEFPTQSCAGGRKPLYAPQEFWVHSACLRRMTITGKWLSPHCSYKGSWADASEGLDHLLIMMWLVCNIAVQKNRDQTWSFAGTCMLTLTSVPSPRKGRALISLALFSFPPQPSKWCVPSPLRVSSISTCIRADPV